MGKVRILALLCGLLTACFITRAASGQESIRWLAADPAINSASSWDGAPSSIDSGIGTPTSGTTLTADGDALPSTLDLEARIQKLEAAAEAAAKPLTKTPAKPTPTFPTLQVNGVFQADAATFDQSDESRAVYGDVEGGADFRRARLSAKGAVSDQMDYFMQMDFGFFGRPTFTDLWVDFKEAGPLGTVRVGQWKHPFSLEVVSSFRYTTFMERSSSFQAFTPFRHLGIGFYDHAEDLNSTWALSYLRTGQDQFGGSLSTDGGNGLAGRWTQVFGYCAPRGHDYLHLGGGYFLNAPPQERLRFRSIPELYVGDFALPAGEPIGTSGQAIPTVANGTPFFVDTGTLSGVDLAHTLNAEALWVCGPLSWQTEGYTAFVDSTNVGDLFFWGTYSQFGWFLTGEHRPYDRQAGAIDRVIPFHSVSKSGTGWGAWEIAARWSVIDLTDDSVLGGQMQNITGGLNWYVNPYCKCVFNYVHAWTDSRATRNGSLLGPDLISATTNGFGLRCQIDF